MWNVCGYIVTKRTQRMVNGLPVYEIDEIQNENNIFIIVSVFGKSEIYETLNNRGFREELQYK